MQTINAKLNKKGNETPVKNTTPVRLLKKRRIEAEKQGLLKKRSLNNMEKKDGLGSVFFFILMLLEFLKFQIDSVTKQILSSF